jgi:hypothetical protein
MNYKALLKSWCLPSNKQYGRSQSETKKRQIAVSLVSLRGWWRKGHDNEQQQKDESDNPVRQLTPWSHGLF